MTTELLMLVLAALLVPALTVPIIVGYQITPGGMAWGVGNRDPTTIEFPGWHSRARRAHGNLVENLPTFAALVLAAHLLHRHDTITVAAAVTFFVARVLHALVYIAGVTGVRSALFIISILAEVALGARILF